MRQYPTAMAILAAATPRLQAWVTQPANAPRAEVKVTKTSSEQNSGSPSGQAASPDRATCLAAARDESTLLIIFTSNRSFTYEDT
jgi:hypothetical protein